MRERHQSWSARYFKNASGVILVYDTCNFESYRNVESWVDEMNEHFGGAHCMVLVGNKKDKCRTICRQKGEILAEKLGIDFVETSAFTGENVKKAFQLLA